MKNRHESIGRTEKSAEKPLKPLLQGFQGRPEGGLMFCIF